ncbi:N-acyl homoserine lactonase family protein [Microbacterium sp. NPDC077663]|uniref:N-acyl homoserine lactonase family protein n=1 Tax=Microbacterium sp. NPDC077663 TaxID=3364189 RepID=UPI0037CA4AE1
MGEATVLALRVGSQRTTASRSYYRHASYGEPDVEQTLDFYFWLVRTPTHTMLVDTGFSERGTAHRAGVEWLIDAREAVIAVGVDPDEITHIIVTHLHYDHVGNLHQFPSARLLIQRREIEFWNSWYAAYPPLASTVEPEELAYIRERIAAGTVDVLDGSVELAPGISVIEVGGHTPGQQVVVVEGSRPIVLASDALHFYEEMDRDLAFNVYSDIADLYQALATFREMRRNGAVIVAGHDPAVMTMFETVCSVDGVALAVQIR